MTWEEAVIWLRQQPDKTQLVRDCFFDDPLTAAANRYYHSTEWQAVRKLLPHPPGRALDLGAGRGISSYAMAQDGWRVTSIDPDNSSLVGAGAIRSLAGETGSDIKVIEDWGETLPFADQQFDLVYARQVLHHAHDLTVLCKEAYRVLKPGGIFLSTREHTISKQEDLRTFLDAHPLHQLYGGEHAYTLADYKAAITGSGIKLIRILKPYDSDINLFPDNRDKWKNILSRKFGFTVPDLAVKCVLAALNLLDRTPGRLYSFLGQKA